MERGRSGLEQDKNELAKELENAQLGRAESEKHRKQAEAKILELQHALDEQLRAKETLDQQLGKVGEVLKFILCIESNGNLARKILEFLFESPDFSI